MIVFAVIMCILGLICAGQLGDQIGDGHPILGVIAYSILSYIAGSTFGATGIVILGSVAIIAVIIAMIFSKSSSPSLSASMGDWAKSRENGPHTCGNCRKYSSGRGECGRNGNPKSAGDSCSNWD